MDMEERVNHLQDEVTLIKAEIKQVLIQLREMVNTPRSYVSEADVANVVIHRVQHESGDAAIQ